MNSLIWVWVNLEFFFPFIKYVYNFLFIYSFIFDLINRTKQQNNFISFSFWKINSWYPLIYSCCWALVYKVCRVFDFHLCSYIVDFGCFHYILILQQYPTFQIYFFYREMCVDFVPQIGPLNHLIIKSKILIYFLYFVFYL